MTANLCGNSASTGVTHYTVLGSEDRFPNEMGEKKKKKGLRLRNENQYCIY